jgi:putative ATP-dependent endonuclease of OLD family
VSIRAMYVKRFRSILSTRLSPCANFNVLIGKNNAGKSNLLAALELTLRHLKDGSIAGPLHTARPSEAFTDRDRSKPIRIGIEFDLPPSVNSELQSRLTKESPQLEKSVEQITAYSVVSFIVKAVTESDQAFAYLEQMGVGTISEQGDTLSINGLRLLGVNQNVAGELYQNFISAGRLRRDIEFLDNMANGRQFPLDYIIDQPKEARFPAVARFSRGDAAPETLRGISSLLNSVSTREELANGVRHLIEETKGRIDRIGKQELSGAISAFAGDIKTPPAYARWLMQQFGELPTLHIRETKRPIGKEEAKMLLELKITRGGPKRFAAIQETMRNLLGINLDAFQAEVGREAAEMDVDEFLVEANGAGIRGALRIMLDLELNAPELALIEEPEVHMHPGLARVVASYLRERSDKSQIFMTTHSTDFIDFVPFENVFLVSRDKNNHTVSELLAADDAVLRVPSELGLRLSSFFLFDRLVFVEGPSDEAVIRQLARNLNIEFAKRNVGFVYMKGVRNFAHFAAPTTLDLLSRRQIRMWFIVDRDENDDKEVQAMMVKLGGRAELKVFPCRELENQLLDPFAVTALIEYKRSRAGTSGAPPAVADVTTAIEEEAANLKPEAIRLRVEKRLLQPVFLHSRASTGTVAERLQSRARDLTDRLGSIEAVEPKSRTK